MVVGCCLFVVEKNDGGEETEEVAPSRYGGRRTPKSANEVV